MRRSSLLLSLLTLTIPVALAAQVPQPREGFWISLGLSAGPKWLSCGDLCSEKFGGGTGGGVTGRHHRRAVGDRRRPVSWFPWSDLDTGYNDTPIAGALLFSARHYPRAESGLF
jgi:hypothetical protein